MSDLVFDAPSGLTGDVVAADGNTYTISAAGRLTVPNGPQQQLIIASLLARGFNWAVGATGHLGGVGLTANTGTTGTTGTTGNTGVVGTTGHAGGPTGVTGGTGGTGWTGAAGAHA